MNVQVMPEVSSDQRMHVLDVSCWCEPVIETVNATPKAIRHRDEVTGEAAEYPTPTPDIPGDAGEPEPAPDVSDDEVTDDPPPAEGGEDQ